MTTRHAARAAAVAVITLAAVSGCGEVVTGKAQRSSAGQAAGPGACTKVDAPLDDLVSRSRSEPKLRVPQPNNWKPIGKMARGSIRFVMANPTLLGNMFAPNIVVTLEDAPVLDAKTILDNTQRNLRKQNSVSNFASTRGTLCGLPADTITFGGERARARGRRSVTTKVIVAGVGNRQFVVTMTAQTADPSNQTYQKDVKTVMDGLQILAPSV